MHYFLIMLLFFKLAILFTNQHQEKHTNKLIWTWFNLNLAFCQKYLVIVVSENWLHGPKHVSKKLSPIQNLSVKTDYPIQNLPVNYGHQSKTDLWKIGTIFHWRDLDWVTISTDKFLLVTSFWIGWPNSTVTFWIE